MIRALVVDDERIARQGLVNLLSEDSDIEIVGECSNGRDALATIEAERPDLVFLDVEMPDLDGISVVREIDPDDMPVIVFVTAYDEYAIEAYEVSAIDYLLKPFDRDRLRESLARAKRSVANRELQGLADRMRDVLGVLGERPGASPVDRIVIRDRGNIRIVKCEEIDWIEARGNYLRVHVGETNYLHRESLTSLYERLDRSAFLRISRSLVLNAVHVSELRKLPNGCYDIVLKGGMRLTSSRRYAGQIAEFFGES